MHILGFQKTTLLDYPGKLAATIFLGGCNFCCPFCHNADLVLHPDLTQSIPYSEVYHTLKKRANVLEGVCITGGEPTLSKDLPELIHNIRDLGFLIKLDTNGSNPDMLQSLIDDHLIDYIAMDIKNSPAKYSMTTGRNVDLSAIEASISCLKEGRVDYEFRTTVVKEFHQVQDFHQIGSWLQGAKRYYLQNFVDSDHLICSHTFSSYSKEELTHFVHLLQDYLPDVQLRGID